MTVALQVDPSRALPDAAALPKGLHASLPRIGVALAVDKGLTDVAFYGRGPHENYPDRKAGATLREHAVALADMHTPYVVPGENGGRCDVRWLRVAEPG